MDTISFKNAVEDYRNLMEGVAVAAQWASADWSSEVWLEGSRHCLEIADMHVPAGSRVLDFGCGVGFMTVLLGQMGYRVTGIDIDVGNQPEVVEKAFMAPWGTWQLEKTNPSFLQDCWLKTAGHFDVAFHSFDGMSIPFEDDSFDAVFAHAVIEHVRPDILIRVIQEIRRVLKDDGILLILRTPRSSSYLERLFRLRFLRRYAHQILYDEGVLSGLVIGEGFRLRQEEVTDMFPAFPPYGMRPYNTISPFLIKSEGLLLRTPLRKYAHHMAFVFQKTPD